MDAGPPFDAKETIIDNGKQKEKRREGKMDNWMDNTMMQSILF